MLTKTTQSAIRELIYLAIGPQGTPISPRSIAERLGLSPTYTAKVTALLVRARILHDQRGAQGGVTLAREPGSIAILEIYEACQGKIVSDSCQPDVAPDHACGFHQFAVELHETVVKILSRWSLVDLIERPTPSCLRAHGQACQMAVPGGECRKDPGSPADKRIPGGEPGWPPRRQGR